ncbi:GNAT family N-acetyltransferase [Crocinitomix catalasitica]|uniref:GNAT family N-acetyltransferase n=1 Tax=Crocinitomix catalasitica TaxID=184607 RepID=UPI001FE074DD|nr:GNAT family N-acetyltransferase [Crocinitomix catalasitica]
MDKRIIRMIPIFKKYKNSDKAAILAILAKNTPEYFHPDEATDLNNYLDNEIEDYFIVEVNGKIIGSGGINYFSAASLARISWDVIDPNFHGQGWGKKLIEHRISWIKEKAPEIQKIEVRTTQLTHKFYEKMGFELIKTEQNFWAEGFDLYQMEMQLS